MGTSISDISEWFERGLENGATHMMVVCDTFSYEDYPVFIKPTEKVKAKLTEYNGPNMQKVMEVYDLRLPKAMQLRGGTRVWNLDD